MLRILSNNSLESIIDTREVELELPNGQTNKRKAPTSITTTTTTSTSSSTSTSTSSTSSTINHFDSPQDSNHKKIKTYDNKPHKTTEQETKRENDESSGVKTPAHTRNTNDTLTPEDIANILKQEDEAMQKEREKLANDDFQIGGCSTTFSIMHGSCQSTVLMSF